MKKHCLTFLPIVCLGLLSWGTAQTTKREIFDLKKSQQELEIMKGILSTTLGFVLKEIRSRDSSDQRHEDELTRAYWKFSGFSGITAFYLPGQGAIFIIPASSFRHLLGKAFPHTPGAFAEERFQLEADLENLNEEIAVLAQEQANLALEGVLGGVEGGVLGGVKGGVSGGVAGRVGKGVKAPRGRASTVQAPSPAPAPPAPAVAPRSPQKEDKIRKKLADAQEKVKKRREEAELKRSKLLEQIAQVKLYLLEALANHGDSLTHVKPNEYITIIITTDEAEFFSPDSLGSRFPHREVLSVQKSAIIDYKAGRLTLDVFKQRVLDYNN